MAPIDVTGSHFNFLHLQIGRLVAEGGSFGSTPAPSVSITLKVEDVDKKSAALADDSKKLSHLTVRITKNPTQVCII